MKRQWIVIWIAVLFVSLGCALFSPRPIEEPRVAGTVVEEEKATEASKDAPVTGEDAPVADKDAQTTGEDTPFTLDPNALDGLDSYRMSMTWTIASEEGSAEEVAVLLEATRDPAAQRYVMQFGDESMEFIRIEQTQWMRFGDQWMQSTSSDDDDLDEFGDFFIDPEDMFARTDKDAFKDMGTETVNGMKTRRYQLKDPAWDVDWGFGATDIKEMTVDMWIVEEKDLPKFAARYEMAITGTFEEEGEGTLSLIWNIYDVNAPITIDPPEDVAGLPAGLELCPDAFDVMTMGGMSFFTCPGTFEDTVTFYSDMLKDGGWQTGDESFRTEDMLMGSWTKGGATLNVTITVDDDGTNVMLVLDE